MFSFKSSFKSSSSGKEVSKSRIPEASDMQEELGKLQEELVKEKQEKVRSLDEMEEVKKSNKKKNKLKGNGDDQLDLAHRLEQLEVELEAAKDSEKQMLVSLEAQTKQLEQTKVSLEEAKLQIASLQDNNKSLEAFTALSSNPSMQPAKNFRRRGVMSFSFADPGEVEMFSLQRQLKLAVEAEEKCKKAMDDLAIALKEQTTVARETKSELSLVQAELKSARTEVENSKASLESLEEKLWLAQEEAGRLKFESDELATASKEKERGLLDCIKIFEGEVNKAKEENDKLFESQKVIRVENSRLREMLKHAVNEANVARESLEIARVENSQLHEDMSEKDSALKSIVQEYESLKVSEAAAQSSIKELKDMIDAMFSSESTRTSAEASPRDPVGGGERKGRYVGADDMYSDVERSPHQKDIRSPARQNKRTILRKFGDIMKKRNPQSVV
ncbi:myosin-11-like [Lolium rigidum]|uniref:myosin-11-like n=1 Tax=Lolium rigidum TaxID=89674 RepID=UPI001F5C9542|nr:myosin-11-like [Lolium rigidum]XP_047075448.1 myosin-11-like [Lolium rigidum]XP_047075449.1 myosin-11-like [Lolium rigidum]